MMRQMFKFLQLNSKQKPFKLTFNLNSNNNENIRFISLATNQSQILNRTKQNIFLNIKSNFFTITTTTTTTTTNKRMAQEEQDESADSKSIPETRDIFGEEDNEQLLNLVESYSACRKEMNNKWLSFGKTCHIYLYRGGGEPKSNLAAFDLDGTIIKPKSNKRIPKSATDWTLFSVWTKVKLQQIVRENNARFVIFTNQNGVGLRLVALEEIQERIELVTKRLDIPCTVLVATEKDQFRKPELGMFKLFKRAFNDSVEIDLRESFYCGDAIGYPSHSDADIKFASTLSLPFLQPEKFLRGVKPKLVCSE